MHVFSSFDLEAEKVGPCPGGVYLLLRQLCNTNWPRCSYCSEPKLALHKLFLFDTLFSQEIVCDLEYIE